MKDKLKTLKDLRDMYGDSHGMVNTWKLKEEAIKWVKVRKGWLKEKDFGESTEEQIETYKYGVNREIAVLTFFFNITEEDLKDKEDE